MNHVEIFRGARDMALVECRLSKVVMSENHDRQVIVLKEIDGERKFPIIIGFLEVFAIHRFVNDEKPPRPLTHELLGNVLDGLDISLERVVVTELKNMTFYADLVLSQEGQEVHIDSRPSDAIAMAVQRGAPILVDEEVISQASQDFD